MDQQNKTFSTQLPPNAFQSLELVSTAPKPNMAERQPHSKHCDTLWPRPTAEFKLQPILRFVWDHRRRSHIRCRRLEMGKFSCGEFSRSGRFLDSRNLRPSMTSAIVDDFRSNRFPARARDSLHLNIFGARNWFQIPNTYDQSARISASRLRRLVLASAISTRSIPKLCSP